MRLLKRGPDGEVSVTEDLSDAKIPPYVILSHTWSLNDRDEVTFEDVEKGQAKYKLGWHKLEFCASQATKDGVEHFWIDTCCINKANGSELSEAINSMFRWYKNASKCYVYLTDVWAGYDDDDNDDDDNDDNAAQPPWEVGFRNSRWFKRGWTLQELLAPATVEFFSWEQKCFGTKNTLEQLIHEITTIPIAALRGKSLSEFPVEERERWKTGRSTKRKEDEAYCLQGIFNVFMPPIYGEGENAMRRLKAQISQLSQVVVTSYNHEHWLVTRPRNSLFTGRDSILRALDKIIVEAVQYPQPEKQCRIVISGIGGEGKSELCFQLAIRNRQRFWGVFWIDASTMDLAERSFLNIAHELSLSAQSWEDARLRIANLKHPWLLVLDNADDPSVDYQQYFPESPLGVVILTSRNEDCHQYATDPVRLEGLDEKEAQDLLLKAAKIPQDKVDTYRKDAQVVAGLLQSHALALVQAGAYISSGPPGTLADYPQIYKRQRRQLLAFRPKHVQSRYGDVYATFEASADILKTLGTETAEDALQLLSLLAMCGPNRLPLFQLFEAGWLGSHKVPADRDNDAEYDNVQLLAPWHIAHLPSLVDTTRAHWDSHRLVEAVKLLEAFSLVSSDSQPSHRNISMHPLVHAWARDRQDKAKLHQSWLQMSCLVSLGSSARETLVMHEQQLQSHVEEIVAWDFNTIFMDEPTMMVVGILVKCGHMLNGMRSDIILFSLLERLFDHLQLNWQIIERQWLGVYKLKGRNLRHYGDVREAITLLGNIVKIEQETLTEDHPDLLMSQRRLASAYRGNGQIKEAVTLLERVVEIQKQSLPKNQLSQLETQHELAITYHANRQIKDALELLESIVKSKKQYYAEDHPNLLESQHELARAYYTNAQMEKAVEILESVVKIKKQHYAEDHSILLMSQYELARAYLGNDQIKEGVELSESIVKIQEQCFAEDHPAQLASQRMLAGAYVSNLQTKEGVALMKSVLNIQERCLPEGHPVLLSTQHALGAAYSANGQIEEAVPLLKSVVKIREQSLEEDDPALIGSQASLAIALWAAGDRHRALEMMEHVVEHERKALDANHLALSNFESWLNDFKRGLGLPAPSLPYTAIESQALVQGANGNLTQAQQHQEGNVDRTQENSANELGETLVSTNGDITTKRPPLDGGSRAALKARTRTFVSKLTLRLPKP